MGDDLDVDAGAVIPLIEERLTIRRGSSETGRVRVHISTETEQALVRETLRGEVLEIERIVVGREVAIAPAVREEEGGAVLVVPVLEEILVVERRLVLKEELRIRRLATTETVEEAIPLRRQTATVERLPAAAPEGSRQSHGRPDNGTESST